MDGGDKPRRHPDFKFERYGITNHGFMGLMPGSEALEGDWDVDLPDAGKAQVATWNVDGPDALNKEGKPRNFRMWMSGVNQPQPVMLDAPNYADEDTPQAPKEDTLPHPTLLLPPPLLTHDFRMSVKLNPRISVGKTPFGDRKWISFKGGSWSGSFGTGRVLPGGQDIQIVTENLSARIDTQYMLQTNDNPPAFIMAKTHGWRTGPPEVLEALADPQRADSVPPTAYKFRIFVELETGDERYRDEVNCGMWVGSGMRKGAEVIYE